MNLTQQLEDKKKELEIIKKNVLTNENALRPQGSKYLEETDKIVVNAFLRASVNERKIIAILEQAIAEIKKRDKDIDELAESSTFALCALMKENKELKDEIKKQRQEILDKIDKLPRKDIEPRDDDYGLYTEVKDSKYGGFVKVEDLELLKQQLNQPKTEQ